MLPTQFDCVRRDAAPLHHDRWSEAMTDVDWDQRTVAAFSKPSAGSEMHELGNAIVALQYCLRQLGGRQRTNELEKLVRTGLEVCENGIAAFRKVQEERSVHH
jgi:hypothetical protein